MDIYEIIRIDKQKKMAEGAKAANEALLNLRMSFAELTDAFIEGAKINAEMTSKIFEIGLDNLEEMFGKKA